RMACPGEDMGTRRGKAKTKAVAAEPAALARRSTVPLPAAIVRDGAGDYLRQLPALTALYLRETVKSPYFLAIVLTGVLFILGNARVIGSVYGTNTYPVTYQVLEFTS